MTTRAGALAALLLLGGRLSAQCTNLPPGQGCATVATLKIVGPGGYTDHVDIKPGYAANLKIVALDSLGNQITHHVVQWWTSDSAYATVSPGGRITGLRYGSNRVYLQVGLQYTSVPVLVNPFQAAACGTLPTGATCVSVARLTLLPPPVVGDAMDHADAVSGSAYSLNFAAYDSVGAPISRHTVAWWSGTPPIDSVSAGGRLTGRAPGVGAAWVRVGLTMGWIPVCVSSAATYPLQIAFDSSHVVVGDSVRLQLLDTLVNPAPIGISWLRLARDTAGRRFQGAARDAAASMARRGPPCVHWRSHDPRLVVDRTGLMRVAAPDSAITFPSGLPATATLGPRIP
jgi:hypothetical protein